MATVLSIDFKPSFLKECLHRMTCHANLRGGGGVREGRWLCGYLLLNGLHCRKDNLKTQVLSQLQMIHESYTWEEERDSYKREGIFYRPSFSLFFIV